MGPILTKPSLTYHSRWDEKEGFVISYEQPYQRVCYGQLIDLDNVKLDHGPGEFSETACITVVNWAKKCPVDDHEAEAFLAKYAAMWPQNSCHSDALKMFISVGPRHVRGNDDFSKGILHYGEAISKLT
jgi:hypothetical protein